MKNYNHICEKGLKARHIPAQRQRLGLKWQRLGFGYDVIHFAPCKGSIKIMPVRKMILTPIEQCLRENLQIKKEYKLIKGTSKNSTF